MSTYQFYLFKTWPIWYIYICMFFILSLKPINHMHYKEWSQTVKIFKMIDLRTNRDNETRCKDHLQILKLSNVTESACSSQFVQAFLFIKKRLNSLTAQDTSFSTSVTLGVLPIVTFCEKDFLGERELCDILHEYICIWRSVRLISIVWPYLICCTA